jgi:hypothetical protein
MVFCVGWVNDIRFELMSEEEVKERGQNFRGHGVNKGEKKNNKAVIHRKCNTRGTNPGVIEAGVAGQEMR